jgi:hypothetical protein
MTEPVEAVTVRPGETLVVRYTSLTPQRASEISERLQAMLPGVRVLVVQADQIAKLTAETLEEATRLAMENPGRVVEVDG